MSFEKGTYKSSVHVVIGAGNRSSRRTEPADLTLSGLSQDPPGAPAASNDAVTSRPWRKHSDSSVHSSRSVLEGSREQKTRSASVAVAPVGIGAPHALQVSNESSPDFQSHSPKYARTFSGGEVTMEINLLSSTPSGHFHDQTSATFGHVGHLPQYNTQEKATAYLKPSYLSRVESGAFMPLQNVGLFNSRPDVQESKPSLRGEMSSCVAENHAGTTQCLATSSFSPSVHSRMTAFESTRSDKKIQSAPDFAKPMQNTEGWQKMTRPFVTAKEQQVCPASEPALRNDIIKPSKPSQITVRYGQKKDVLPDVPPHSTTATSLPVPDPPSIQSSSLDTPKQTRPKLSEVKSQSLDLYTKGFEMKSDEPSTKYAFQGCSKISERGDSPCDITQRWTGRTNLKPRDKGRRKLTGINSPLAHNFKEIKSKFDQEEPAAPSYGSQLKKPLLKYKTCPKFQFPDSIKETSHESQTARNLSPLSTPGFSQAKVDSLREGSVANCDSSLEQASASSGSVSSEGFSGEVTLASKPMKAESSESPIRGTDEPLFCQDTQSVAHVMQPAIDVREISGEMHQERLTLLSSQSCVEQLPEVEKLCISDTVPLSSTCTSNISLSGDQLPNGKEAPVMSDKVADIVEDGVVVNLGGMSKGIHAGGNDTALESPNVSTLFEHEDEEDHFESLRKLREKRFSKTRQSSRDLLQLGGSLDIEEVRPQRLPDLHCGKHPTLDEVSAHSEVLLPEDHQSVAHPLVLKGELSLV